MTDGQSINEAGMDAEQETPERRWRPISARQRRVFGVLVEKAKTTVDAYPLTLNALTNGCNQKSNRSPQMNLTADDIEQVLDELREMGAVAEVQGASRVSKYRHYAYDWLGVDKLELAVMTELLLRGEQTLGELRGRAARMETIADVAALRPIVDGLIAKGLVVALSPAGRGQIVTHALLKPKEMDALRSSLAGQANAVSTPPATSSSATSSSTSGSSTSGSSAPAPRDDGQLDALRNEVSELRSALGQLRDQMRELESRLG